jgi:hypothetical protein
VIGRGDAWPFVYFAWRLWKRVLTLATEGDTVSGQGVESQRVPLFELASIAVDRKSMEHTVIERSWKNVVLCQFSVAVLEKCFEACG